MLACSSFTMPFIECGGGAAAVLQEPLSPLSLYSPPIGSESCSTEERLQQTQNQLKNLKDILLTKENDYDDQQQELKFYIIKNEELMDVINTFRCPSEKKAHKLMILKSEQNSELTLQVHSLRDLLQKSGIEIASLTKQIQSLNYKIDSLTNIKDKNQKLQIQINELVQIVNKVDVTITPEIGVDGDAADHDDIASEWNVQWLNNMILPKSVGGGNNAAVDETESESDDTTKSNIQMITRKVITMEADRQRLLKESLQVNQNIDGICKTDQIASLERKVRSMQYEQDTLQETNSALRRQMCVREGKILALEELFQNINTKNRHINGNKKKTRKVIRPSAGSLYRIDRSVSLMNGDESDDDCDYDEDMDINSVTSSGTSTSKQQSFEEMFTSIWTTFSSPVENMAQSLIVGSRSGSRSNDNGSSYLEEEGEDLDDMDDINIDDSSDSSSCHDDMTSSCGAFSSSVTGDSYHTKQVEEELQAAAQKEYNELHSNHHKLCEDYESSQLRITDLTARLEESIIKATSFEKKSELREGLLKDVIQQYKELQLENSTCKDHLRKVKQKVIVLLQFEKERSEQEEQERKNNEEAAVAADVVTAATDGQQKVIGVSKKGGNANNNGGFLEEETPTFDMSENGNEGDEDDGSTSSSLSTSSASSSLYTTKGLVLDEKFMTEDYKRLESECDRLQHEFDTAIDKITSLEEELEEAKVQVHDNQKVSTEKSHKIAVLEKEKGALQERIIEVTAKIVDTQSTHTRQSIEVDTELKVAGQKYEEARKNQMDREQDLWDVIEQYKELAETNNESSTTKEKAADVEHELVSTEKEETQRRDLVYEHRKLEKAMEEAVETGERLSKELVMARNDSAKDKEESKGIRKRLAGCHFHYKQLQEQYDILLKQKDNVERQLIKSQKDEASRRSKIDSLQISMMNNLREKRRDADKVDTLSRENEELQMKMKELLQKEVVNGSVDDDEDDNDVEKSSPPSTVIETKKESPITSRSLPISTGDKVTEVADLQKTTITSRSSDNDDDDDVVVAITAKNDTSKSPIKPKTKKWHDRIATKKGNKKRGTKP